MNRKYNALDTLDKEMLNVKSFCHKTSENLGQYGQANYKTKRN